MLRHVLPRHRNLCKKMTKKPKSNNFIIIIVFGKNSITLNYYFNKTQLIFKFQFKTNENELGSFPLKEYNSKIWQCPPSNKRSVDDRKQNQCQTHFY